jgi:hypothetical protein
MVWAAGAQQVLDADQPENKAKFLMNSFDALIAANDDAVSCRERYLDVRQLGILAFGLRIEAELPGWAQADDDGMDPRKTAACISSGVAAINTTFLFDDPSYIASPLTASRPNYSIEQVTFLKQVEASWENTWWHTPEAQWPTEAWCVAAMGLCLAIRQACLDKMKEQATDLDGYDVAALHQLSTAAAACLLSRYVQLYRKHNPKTVMPRQMVTSGDYLYRLDPVTFKTADDFRRTRP